MIVCDLFDEGICADLLLYVYICIAVGDPIIKREGLASH
jgi:hypothetical protein